jgi:phosphoheptose isomerase
MEAIMKNDVQIYNRLMTDYPALNGLPVWQAYEILLECARKDGKILLCGNGGSAADSEHIVGELMKGFKLPRKLTEEDLKAFPGHEEMACKLQKGVQAISLNSQISLMTAVGNDNGYDMVYAQQVYVYGQKGDVLIGMTTSGNSANVVNAAITAKARGMKVIGITGAKDSKLSACSDLCLRLPAEETYQIQEFTLPIYHALCAMVEDTLFGTEE